MPSKKLRLNVVLGVSASLLLISSTRTSTFGADASNVSGVPQIRVLSQGAEPRAPLHFQFQVGPPVTAKFDMTLKMKASMAGGAMPSMPFPSLSLITISEIKTVNTDKSALISTKLAEFRIGNERVLGSGAPDSDSTTSFGWEYTQTEQGAIQGLSTSLPRNIDPATLEQLNQVQQGLQNSSIIFPKDPIGKGARWEVSLPESASRGIKTQKTMTYTLVDRSNESVSINESIRETAANQSIEGLPGMLPGMSATLNSLDLSGSGQMKLDLRSAAVKGAILAKANQAVSVSPSAETGATQIKLNVQLEIETRFTTFNGKDDAAEEPPQEKPTAVDLKAFVNTPFSSMIRTDDDSFAFPAPLTTKDGIPFQASGLVQLAGLSANPITSRLPDRVNGIKIGKKCRKLHFLHAAGPGGRPDDGTRIGSYVIRYSNGQTVELPIVYGTDLRSWWSFPGESGDSTNAQISWTTTSSGTPVRLFSSSWQNPNPDMEISAVDVTANIARPGLFLAGITTE